MANIISLSSLSRSEFDKIKKNFHCSFKQLEEHIKQYAFTHQKEGLFQTYFYVEDGKYLGYISLAIASIDREKFDNELDIPSSMKYAIPALKITRLCIFDEYIKQGVGTILIYFVKVLATTLQKKIGCRAVIVDSKEEAVSFYKQYDYIPIASQDDDNTIFMLHDLLQPKELEESIKDMVLFCETYGQMDLIDILKH